MKGKKVMRNEYTTIFKDIEYHRELIRKQKKEIEEKQMIVDSLTYSMVHKVKQIITPYSDRMLHAAFCEQNKPTKKERTMFEFVKNDLLERLFDKDERKEVEFANIISLGYDNCVYHFQFKYKGTTFELSVPNVKVADAKNVWHMWYGMYVLRYEEKRSVWDHIKESYELDDIAKAIKEFVEKGECHERN